MPTSKDQLIRTVLRDALHRQLVDYLSPDLIENPQLGEVAERTTEDIIDKAFAPDGQPLPPDGGLAQLVGLGTSTAPSLEGVEEPGEIKEYDDRLTPDRITAVADLYYLYQHEKIGIFSAVLKLQELFRAGTVRLSAGPGALALYRYDRRRVLRYTQIDRLQAYRRVFGYTRTSPAAGAHSNDRFHPLFVHFITQIAEFYRDKRVSEVIRPRANDPSFGSIAIVRRAGLDLRNNVKHASYGHVMVLRTEMQQLLNEAFLLLGEPDILRLFGAEHAWDVVEEVMRQYLGRPQVNASQRNRMAVAGRDILNWIAQPDILTTNREEFEGLLVTIADRAEEWITSAEAAGLTQTRSGVRRGRLPGIDRPMSATQAAQGAARPAQRAADLGAVPVMANGHAPVG